jgi:hypothetical protein
VTFLIPAEVHLEGRCIGRGSYDEDEYRLWSEIEWTWHKTTVRLRPSECDHGGFIESAFVYVDWPLRKHWPIRFCTACRTITAGASPLAWKDDPADPDALAWNQTWPKRGRPRRPKPPEDTPWEAVS